MRWIIGLILATALIAATVGTTLMKLANPPGDVTFTTLQRAPSADCRNWIGFDYQFTGKLADWPDADTVMVFVVDGLGQVVSSQGVYSPLGEVSRDSGWIGYDRDRLQTRWLTTVMIDTRGYQPDDLDSPQQVFDWAQSGGLFIAEDVVDLTTLDSSCASLPDSGPFRFE
jgi:hypothetical protein